MKTILLILQIIASIVGQDNLISSSPSIATTTSSSPPTTKYSGPGRDFLKWFDNIEEDSWGNIGFVRVVNQINSNILDSSVLNWLEDIRTVSDKYFPKFCNTGNDSKDKQEFAAFMTAIAVKTSFDVEHGFPCSKESGCPNCTNCSYNSKGQQCMSQKNKQYFGRGPLLMQWDNSYKNFSNFFYNDERLLKTPDNVTDSTASCWAAAIWQWMTPQKYGGWCFSSMNNKNQQICNKQCPNGPSGCKQTICTKEKWIDQNVISAHDAIHQGGGIGQIINIYTGVKNCCPSTKSFTGYGNAVNMVEIFSNILLEWNEPLPFDKIDNFSISSCPAAEKKKLSCAKLLTNDCTFNCCSIIS